MVKMKKWIRILMIACLILTPAAPPFSPGAAFASESQGPDTAWHHANEDAFRLSKADELAGLTVLSSGGESLAGKTVLLEKTEEPGYGEIRGEIYGDGNDGMDYVISEGGSYLIGEGATGIITVDTTEDVVLAGQGVEEEGIYSDLFINCPQPGSSLTLWDVGISDFENTSNVIGFTGGGNVLGVEGTCLLDYDYGFTSRKDALIHVPYGGSLEIRGAGTLYQYNNTQGAGIGGDTREMNGDIIFSMTGSAFIKGTRQGAVIGAGANARSDSSVPGSITFLSGTYNFETNSRGAAIGGSAGSGGASDGTEVYLKGGSININCDYTGSAVGGGGYKSGNDSSGGTVYITGGSLRTYIDKNAAVNENGGFNNALFSEGVNDAVIMAQRLNDQGETVYKCAFDTTGLGEGLYTVYIDGKEFYTGGRHDWAFINESLSKDENEQIEVTRTQDNWIPNDEPNLYFYLTGRDHTIKVGDRTYMAAFHQDALDEEGHIADSSVYTTGAFTVSPAPEPAFRTHSVLLSGQIGLNFFMELPGDPSQYADSYMEFTLNGTKQRAVFNPDKMNVTGKYYGFTCYVNSVSMADEIQAVFHKDGQDPETVVQTYSISQYVEACRERESEFDQKTVNLVHALADYGHFIQPFLAGSAGWTLGEDHREMTGFIDSYDMDEVLQAAGEYKVFRDTGSSDLETITFALLLDTETSVYVYLRAQSGYTGKIDVKVDGKKASISRQADGRYRVSIPNISAHLLGKTHQITVSTESGTAEVSISALSYIRAVLDSPVYSGDQDAQYAMASLYYYYLAADAMKKE